MIMEAVVEQKSGIYALLKGYKALPQISVSVPVTDKTSALFGINELCKKLEKQLGLRLVVRPSGTEPVVRVMAEGESEENCALACKILINRISANA